MDTVDVLESVEIRNKIKLKFGTMKDERYRAIGRRDAGGKAGSGGQNPGGVSCVCFQFSTHGNLW